MGLLRRFFGLVRDEVADLFDILEDRAREEAEYLADCRRLEREVVRLEKRIRQMEERDRRAAAFESEYRSGNK